MYWKIRITISGPFNASNSSERVGLGPGGGDDDGKRHLLHDHIDSRVLCKLSWFRTELEDCGTDENSVNETKEAK